MRPDSLGPYTLGTPLGKGGMGAVYRARHRETGDEVAVKILSPRLAVAEGFRDRFEGEIESLKALRHAGIVRLNGYGEEEGVLFYAMELVDGPSLEEELRNGRRFDWRETTQIAIQVCRALKHAHDHGVVHRDLKPANILLAPNGMPKLADFGIARMFGSTGVTIAGGVLGTADYMSPEQAAGTPVTARCDQYSLGGVLYALLTGRPPFRAADMAAMLQLQRFAIPEPVRRFAPDTPQELERIIGKLLEKDPADRFPNTWVVARRLEAMTQGLARVAADDFELYHTAAAAAEAETGDEATDALALAVTRDVVETEVLPPTSERQRLASPTGSIVTEGATYTHVDPDRAAAEASRWASVLGLLTVIGLMVASLVWGLWWFRQPPSADTLYYRVASGVDRGDVSAKTQEAAQTFVERFPDDERAEEVAEWARTLQLEQKRRRMKLARWIGGGDVETPEELLMQRATELAGASPAAGAAAFDALSRLLRTDRDPSVETTTLAKLAAGEAQRLREENAEQRQQIADYFVKRLAKAAAGDLPSVAEAVLALAPESAETAAVRDQARAILAGEASASGRAPVAPDGALR
ncbi:Serine/threonine-protein kinase PknB [Botrimarina colliarenosi]|uniref:non-specific serine/threonine protein kinase n=1 Tax=Botrimarina colliarenosi TaxID=2528001 RepID=A0A5C6A6Z2_9BACT|nr:serine/threonine-protein kinase [Botrimarina colliarenosi]TWT95206.1 Serine/threonine-protein kinase PknB [Botrimarina colliarenosi]